MLGLCLWWHLHVNWQNYKCIEVHRLAEDKIKDIITLQVLLQPRFCLKFICMLRWLVKVSEAVRGQWHQRWKCPGWVWSRIIGLIVFALNVTCCDSDLFMLDVNLYSTPMSKSRLLKKSSLINTVIIIVRIIWCMMHTISCIQMSTFSLELNRGWVA